MQKDVLLFDDMIVGENPEVLEDEVVNWPRRTLVLRLASKKPNALSLGSIAVEDRTSI